MAELVGPGPSTQRFDAVLFDWMLTLAHYPTPAACVAYAMAGLGRPIDDGAVTEMVEAMERAELVPKVAAALAVVDTSEEAHRVGECSLYREAGFDEEMVDAMYRPIGAPEFHPPYADVHPTLKSLSESGYALGVVSDIHVDLRTHADLFGFGEFIDAWSLSWEQGIQKPNLQMFRTALDQLNVAPERTLMVGDRGMVDGAAAALGVTCLILPQVDRTDVDRSGRPCRDRGLSLVLDLVGL